jgi:pimeloyl-ACP methyl ester carboxylesterase
MLATRKDNGFTDTVAAAIKKALDPLACTNEGIVKNRLRVVSYPYSLAECTPEERRYIYKMVPLEQLSEVVGESHLYFFSYHSFGQVYETAKQLHSYIQMVKGKTGHDKVNLVPVSLGGSLAVAYLDAYGYKNDINRVVNFVPAVNGSTVVADLMEGKLDFSNPAELFEFIFGSGTAEKICSYLKFFPSGMADLLLKKTVAAAVEVIACNSPQIWAVVPHEKYTSLRAKYLCDGKHEALRAKADRFHRAHSDLASLVKREQERGVEFFSICGYGRQLIPFCGSRDVNSDTVVDLKSASLGAYSPAFGEALPADYKNEHSNCSNPEHNHISPDRTVDASTSLIPDSVWFFKGQIHDDTAYNDVALLICRELLTNKKFNSVYSDPRFPQFNGARNIRKIKYNLLPQARELDVSGLPEAVKKELCDAVSECEKLFSYTIVEDNSLAQNATERLAAALDSAKPQEAIK